MLVYLFTLRDNGAERYGNIEPAGVLYLPSDPAPPDDDGSAAAGKVYRADGLVLDDEKVIKAMDRDATGLFIPVSFRAGKARKTEKLASYELMGSIAERTDEIIVEMASALYNGEIEASPLVDGTHSPCEYCDYAAVCRRDRITHERKIGTVSEEDFLKKGDRVDA